MNPADCGRQGRAAAIVRFQSRSGRWTSWPEAGAERDRRRRSDIKHQVHRQDYAQWLYRHKHSHCSIYCIWCLYSRSAVGMHAKSMQKISGSKPVCIFFEPWYEQVCTGMYAYVRVCTSMNQYVWVHTGMYQYVLVCTIIYL